MRNQLSKVFPKFAILFLVLSLVLWPACGGNKEAYTPSLSPEPEKIKVVASIFPLADFARNVGGELVDVVTLLPPGASPHVYEPSPGKVKDLAEARLFIENGAGLEFWAEKLVNAVSSSDLVVVNTSAGIDLLGGTGEEGANPHIWLDPLLAQKQVNAIRDALIQIDPQNKDYYESNATGYLAELASLDAELQQRISQFRYKAFISFHAAWSYFAARYGLIEAGVIEESPGRDPSAAQIKGLIDKVKELNVKAIFAESQFNPKAASTVAAESGAKVITLDPLGGTSGRNSYIEIMHYNVGQMVGVME
jgi:zinc transport system substrate-binding protein